MEMNSNFLCFLFFTLMFQLQCKKRVKCAISVRHATIETCVVRLQYRRASSLAHRTRVGDVNSRVPRSQQKSVEPKAQEYAKIRSEVENVKTLVQRVRGVTVGKVEDNDQSRRGNKNVCQSVQRAEVRMPIARVQHVPFWNDLSPLSCCHHWDDSGTATLYNTGYGVTLQLRDYQHVPSLYGGPIVGTYHLHRVNFHWGPDNENGAHHLIGDTPCAMEIHATYYNSCCDFPLRRISSNSLSEMSSWAVIGMRFAEGARNNAFRTIAQSVQSIREPGSSTKVKYDYLSWLKRPRMDRDYFTYISELQDSSRVTWIIYDEPNTISKAQVDVFRTVMNEDRTPIIESRCKLPVNPIRGEIVFVRDIPFLPN